MSKFKVGEIAIGQNFNVSLFLNGAEVEVIGLLMFRMANLDGVIKEHYGYKIKKQDGGISSVSPDKLRKKKPPQQKSTWEEIQEITNWSPDAFVIN